MHPNLVTVDVTRIIGSTFEVPPATNADHPIIRIPPSLQDSVRFLHTDTTRPLEAVYKREYNDGTRTYRLTFHVPLVQFTYRDSNEPVPNHMYISIYIEGTYERNYLRSHCRVTSAQAVVVSFPVCVSRRRQHRLLYSLNPAANIRDQLQSRGLQYMNVYTVGDMNAAYNLAAHPQHHAAAAAAYVENVENAEKAEKAAPVSTARLAPGDSRACERLRDVGIALNQTTRTTNDLAKGAAREPGKTFAKLRYYYGPNVNVKELSKSHGVNREQADVSLFSWRHVSRVRQQLRRAVTTPAAQQSIHRLLRHIPLETYIEDPFKLAVVAVFPHTTSDSSIVAAVLFTYMPPNLVARAKRQQQPHTPPKQTLAYLMLDGVYIDGKYDECILDPQHLSPKNGIRANLLQAAMQYAHKIYGGHDVLYAGADSQLRSVLLRVGFDHEPVPHSHGSNSSVASVVMTRLQHLVTATAANPVLRYKTAALDCTSWETCKQAVSRKYPNMSLKKKLVMASDIYASSRRKRKGRRSRSASAASHRPPPTRRRTKRVVSVAGGAKLLQSQYAHKYLSPHQINPKSTKNEFEQLMKDPATSAPLRAYSRAIRQNLRRTRKYVVLRPGDNNTWKFRPKSSNSADPPDATTTTATTCADRYVLEGLDADTEPGLSLLKFPLGRATPSELLLRV
jgi:hypothetical protein